MFNPLISNRLSGNQYLVKTYCKSLENILHKMAEKIKFELEFLLKTSSKALENMIFNAAGLAEWFADDVNIKDDVLTFEWEGSQENARLLTKRTTDKIKFNNRNALCTDINAFILFMYLLYGL